MKVHEGKHWEEIRATRARSLAQGGVICVEDLEQMFLDENSINKEREQQFIHQLEMPFTSQIRFDDLLKDVLKLRGGGAGSSVPLKTKSKLAQGKAALEEQLAHLSPGTINVKVRIGGLFEATRQSELVSLSVNSTTTVAKVKEMIFDMVDIPVDTQRLCKVLPGTESSTLGMPCSQILLNERTLADYNIENGHTLFLMRLTGSYQIFVMGLKGTLVMNVESSTTIDTLKLRIQEREGPPPNQFWLSFGLSVLSDCCDSGWCRLTLADYNIQRENTLVSACLVDRVR